LFAGPLYVFYKILHAIKLADLLNQKFPDAHFIPVYYMGSEDADVDELAYTQVANSKLKWETAQKGAVGRMQVNAALVELMQAWYNQVAHHPHAAEVYEKIQRFFQPGMSIQNATFSFLNHFFGERGLLILIPDDKELKRLGIELWTAELNSKLVHTYVASTQDWLKKHYNVQASGREINLFYLEDQLRNRIVESGDGYRIHDTSLVFSQKEMIELMDKNPERMSPNVLLRPLFQEMILPNVAFIGGGGELAYWLSLKAAFDQQKIPFPVLMLRHSFVLLEDSMASRFDRLAFSPSTYFGDQIAFEQRIAKAVSADWPNLTQEKHVLSDWYAQRAKHAKSIDPTLEKHVFALQQQSLKRIDALEKKLMRAIRKRETAAISQASAIREYVIPGGAFQERVEHGIVWYARYGAGFLDLLYNNLDPLDRNASWLLLD
jgi:bacillithiol biosynthesis cysteine-adding enzyme BshC